MRYKFIAAILTMPILASCSYIDPLLGDNDPAPSKTAVKTPEEDVAAPVTQAAVDALPFIPGGTESWTLCPYLDNDFIANTNGQKVLSVGIDSNFDPPACVFWSYAPEPQVQVIVRHMNTREEAIAVVDWAAPIHTTSPANKPEGWTGGRGGDEVSSVYAVHKGNTAVVVLSNQGQSVKTEAIALETIKNLGI